MVRLRSLAAIAVLAAGSVGCCADGKCIKEPPCRPCENPTCLTPIQRVALEKGTHAVDPYTPRVYSWEEKTYVFFTEAGLKDFEKDPLSYNEKGALRIMRAGKTWRCDINPGDSFDWAALKAVTPMPYTPAPKPAR